MVACRLTHLIVAGACWIGGCSRHVHSPPARMVPLESVATVQGNETAVGVEGGAHAVVFGPSLASVAVRARQSIEKMLEAVFETQGVLVLNALDSNSNAHPVIYSLRVGAKRRVTPACAFTGGFGTGYSAGGGFISPDFGMVVAYENRYVVPFFAARTFMSLPLAARRVDLGDDGSGTITQRPRLTFGAQANVGVRIRFDHAAHEHDALLLGIAFTEVIDRQRDFLFVSAAAGIEGAF